jgi:hypothetical protein
LAVVIYKYGCVFVETDVAAIGATPFFSCAHDNTANDLAFLYGGAGDGVFHGGNKHVANGRVASPCASKNSDAQNFFCTGIIGNFESGFLLDHCIYSGINGLVR